MVEKSINKVVKTRVEEQEIPSKEENSTVIISYIQKKRRFIGLTTKGLFAVKSGDKGGVKHRAINGAQIWCRKFGHAWLDYKKE